MSRKIVAQWLLPVFVSLLGLVYGILDYTGATDRLTERQAAEEGIELLLYGDGYPDAFIESTEPQFRALKSIIDANTKNPRVMEIKKEGVYEPLGITIDGTFSRKEEMPDYWPQKTFIPETSQVMYLYDSNSDGKSDKTTWVGRASEVKSWVDEGRNRERFWISTILLSVLSIYIGLARRESKRQQQVDSE